MVFFFEDARRARGTTSPQALLMRADSRTMAADLVSFVLLAGMAVLVFHGAGEMGRPLTQLYHAPVLLNPARLPEYALRTSLRMFAALGASLVFAIGTAMLAARSRKVEFLIIPALDILQSVPVLGFLSFTVTMFMGWFPGSQLGVECAAIFAIFTSQAWNMAFSFYQSLKSLPTDLDDVTRNFGFSPWRRFVRLELPYAIPSLVWNMMMSMSGGWFFVVASEAITVGHTSVSLPGIGAWLSVAIARQDLIAVLWGVATMALVIALYDQVFFRPVIAWADKFRFEQTASQEAPQSWLFDLIQRTRLLRRAFGLLNWPFEAVARIRWSGIRAKPLRLHVDSRLGRVFDVIWYGLITALSLWALWGLWTYLSHALSLNDAARALLMGLATLARVVGLIILASLIWVPIGMWIGLRPVWSDRLQPVAQFLAAFPANVLFPVVVMGIASCALNPDIFLSPLMILGTQWYILFNVIAGASAMPGDMKEVSAMFGIRGWQWWRQVGLPAIFPYYVTGALTASGGCWNAAIVAEAVDWGHSHLEAFGLGAYIAHATTVGDYPRVALGVAVMSLFVIGFNRAVWRPLYGFAERRLRIS